MISGEVLFNHLSRNAADASAKALFCVSGACFVFAAIALPAATRFGFLLVL